MENGEPLEKNTLPESWNKLYEAHARDVGLFLLECNDLQETLADLFATILGFQDGSIARAIWYAIPSDRFQRKALLEAVKRIFDPSNAPPDSDPATNRALIAEIKWMVESADGLGQRRDAAAHSPVAVVIDEPLRLITCHQHGHPLASVLKDTELAVEFRLNAQRFSIVREHAKEIEQYLRYSRKWKFPERPAWPPNPQKKAKARKPVRRPAKH